MVSAWGRAQARRWSRAGFAELSRFGAAFGARPQTLMGLSGLGDLVLTCTSPQSRNFTFGVALGRGRSSAEASAGKLVEGATTARALLEMAATRGVEMPIAARVEAVMRGDEDARAAVGALLARPLKGGGMGRLSLELYGRAPFQ